MMLSSEVSMRNTHDDLERAARQRDFYLKVMPMIGQHIAHAVGGFAIPGIDSQEMELKRNIGHWVKFGQSPVVPMVRDAAWWMSQLTDPHHKLSREQQEQVADHMASYALAVLGQLIDNKIIDWVDEPEIPEIQLAESPSIDFDHVDEATLNRLDASMPEPEDDWNW